MSNIIIPKMKATKDDEKTKAMNPSSPKIERQRPHNIHKKNLKFTLTYFIAILYINFVSLNFCVAFISSKGIQ